MILRNALRPLRRATAGVVLLTYLASCTHMPSGERAFDTFDQCIAGNLGLAAIGGTAIGALGSALARQVTGDRGVSNAVGVAAGVAAAAMIGLSAWKKCAAVYNTSERVALAPDQRPASAPVVRRRPALSLDRLEVRVEGTENDPPIPEFSFSYTAENPAAKDIKARFRHKVEIVRFKPDDHDKLILADAKGDALRDSAGKNIPLEAAIRMPRERLSWVTIAEEGKDDYVEDVVIQQDKSETYRHKLQVPPRAQLPLPLPVPMRYTLTVEADAFKSTRTVDFALLGTSERPRRFAAAAIPGSSDAPSAPPVPPSASPSAPRVEESRPAAAPTSASGATHKVKRSVPLYNDATAKRKRIGRIAKDTPVRIEERAELTTNGHAVEWVRVASANGTGGWLPASELVEGK